MPRARRQIKPTGSKRQRKDATSTNLESALEELAQFDMDMRYGPCIGITRLERWERSARFNLDPPLHIQQLLGDPQLAASIPNANFNLWHGDLG